MIRSFDKCTSRDCSAHPAQPSEQANHNA